MEPLLFLSPRRAGKTLATVYLMTSHSSPNLTAAVVTSAKSSQPAGFVTIRILASLVSPNYHFCHNTYLLFACYCARLRVVSGWNYMERRQESAGIVGD